MLQSKNVHAINKCIHREGSYGTGKFYFEVPFCNCLNVLGSNLRLALP